MTEKPELAELMQKAQEMQKMLQQTQKKLADMTFSGSAGGGMVDATINGRHEVVKIQIGNEAMKAGKDALADLIAAAINDAIQKIEKTSQGEMVKLVQGLGLPPGIGEIDKK